MKTKTWLAASIAMGLTVGFGARVLTGDEIGSVEPSVTATAGNSESRPAEATEGPWMHPAVTVVVKVPAKTDRAFVLAGSIGQTVSAQNETAVEEATEGPWMHPAITVVVQVPAKADRQFVLAGSAGQTVTVQDKAAIEEAAEGPWMHPAITVVVKVPAKAAGVFAMDGSASAVVRPGPARLWSMEDGNSGLPGRSIRNQRRLDGPDFGPRPRGWNGDAGRPGADRSRGSAVGEEVITDGARPRRPVIWDRARGEA